MQKHGIWLTYWGKRVKLMSSSLNSVVIWACCLNIALNMVFNCLGWRVTALSCSMNLMCVNTLCCTHMPAHCLWMLTLLTLSLFPFVRQIHYHTCHCGCFARSWTKVTVSRRAISPRVKVVFWTNRALSVLHYNNIAHAFVSEQYLSL